MGVFSDLLDTVINGYSGFTGGLPLELGLLIRVFIFAIIIAFYAIFTYKFYRYISKKDLIELNLSQYNTSEHPVVHKLLASLLYLLEYIIILPFLIFFWFAVLAFIIFILSEETAAHVIVVSAAIIVAIRMLAYYSDDLSKDLAKMFPFTILTIFIIDQGFFDLSRIRDNLSLLGDGASITAIFYFLILIIAVELLLRVIDLIRGFWESEDERPAGAKTNSV